MPIIRWTSTSRAAHVVWSFSWAAILGGCGIALSLDGYSAEEADLCLDGKKNQNETGIDCGGSCAPCADNQGCIVGTDCTSLVCIGNLCRAPSCTDGVKNGDELGVDCRGSCVSQKCVAGEFCNANNDCIGGQCFENACAETCSDKSQNGQETGLDCGGPDCPGCSNGQECALNSDCESGVCTGGTCIDFHRYSLSFGELNTVVTSFFPEIHMDVNAGERVVMGGQFVGDVDFGKGIQSTQGSAFPKIFVAQFDEVGSCQWSRSFGDSGKSQHVRAVSINTIGAAAITGYHFGVLDIDGKVFQATPPYADAYIAVFDVMGKLAWSRSLSTSGGDEASGISINDMGEVLAAGTYKGTLDVGNQFISSQGASEDIYLVRYQPGGTPIWAKSFGDTADQNAPYLAVNNKGNIALSSNLIGTVNFGGADLSADAAIKSGYIAVLNAQGDHLWSRAFAHPKAGESLNVRELVIDNNDNVTIGGVFSGSIQFDSFVLQSQGKTDIFIARFDSSGKALWARSYGSTEDDTTHSMSVAPDGALLITGAFANTINFDGNILSSAGSASMYLVKLGPDATVIWSRAFGENSSVWSSDVRAAGLEHVIIGAIYRGPLNWGGGDLPLPSTPFRFSFAGLTLPQH